MNLVCSVKWELHFIGQKGLYLSSKNCTRNGRRSSPRPVNLNTRKSEVLWQPSLSLINLLAGFHFVCYTSLPYPQKCCAGNFTTQESTQHKLTILDVTKYHQVSDWLHCLLRQGQDKTRLPDVRCHGDQVATGTSDSNCPTLHTYAMLTLTLTSDMHTPNHTPTDKHIHAFTHLLTIWSVVIP